MPPATAAAPSAPPVPAIVTAPAFGAIPHTTARVSFGSAGSARSSVDFSCALSDGRLKPVHCTSPYSLAVGARRKRPSA